MFKAQPGSVVYAQLYTGISFIGRLPSNWTGDEPSLLLEDALQVVTTHIPVPTPNGIAMNMQISLVPVNHMAAGPETQALDYGVCLAIIECVEQHPLVGAYIQRTSRIQMVSPGEASQLLTPAGRR